MGSRRSKTARAAADLFDFAPPAAPPAAEAATVDALIASLSAPEPERPAPPAPAPEPEAPPRRPSPPRPPAPPTPPPRPPAPPKPPRRSAAEARRSGPPVVLIPRAEPKASAAAKAPAKLAPPAPSAPPAPAPSKASPHAEILILHGSWCAPSRAYLRAVAKLGIPHRAVDDESAEGRALMRRHKISSLPEVVIRVGDLTDWRRDDPSPKELEGIARLHGLL